MGNMQYIFYAMIFSRQHPTKSQNLAEFHSFYKVLKSSDDHDDACRLPVGRD
jgi:hypothetical protein